MILGIYLIGILLALITWIFIFIEDSIDHYEYTYLKGEEKVISILDDIDSYSVCILVVFSIFSWLSLSLYILYLIGSKVYSVSKKWIAKVAVKIFKIE